MNLDQINTTAELFTFKQPRQVDYAQAARKKELFTEMCGVGWGIVFAKEDPGAPLRVHIARLKGWATVLSQRELPPFALSLTHLEKIVIEWMDDADAHELPGILDNQIMAVSVTHAFKAWPSFPFTFAVCGPRALTAPMEAAIAQRLHWVESPLQLLHVPEKGLPMQMAAFKGAAERMQVMLDESLVSTANLVPTAPGSVFRSHDSPNRRLAAAAGLSCFPLQTGRE